MLHHARYVALALSLVFAGSVADAKPAKRAKVTKQAKQAKKSAKKRAAPAEESRTRDAEDEDDDDDDDRIAAEEDEDAPRERKRRKRTRAISLDEEDEDATFAAELGDAKPKRARKTRVKADADRERVAIAAPEDDVIDESDLRADEAEADEADELDAAPVKLRKRKRTAPQAKDWSLAIGPYVWLSAVDANVSAGGQDVGAGVEFGDMTKNAKAGAPIVLELKYKKLSVEADLLYGVVGIEGGREVGPLMATVDGLATMLLVDGLAGYAVYGGEPSSLVTAEARVGTRYQRTAVSASVAVSGNDLTGVEQTNGGADAIAGGRVSLRPKRWVEVQGAADVGAGTSSLTWSASADARFHIGSRVQLTLGYRTLTLDRADVALRMYGPRIQAQFVF